jgi:hypothetical protein
MPMDAEERKIAGLFAIFEEINARVDGTVGRLERAVGNLDPTVRQAIRDTYSKELVGLADQIKKTTASLEGLRRAADWRQLLLGTGLSLFAVAITLGGFWFFTPSPAEMSRMRTERQQLQAAIDLLASHGGRADLRNCGAGNEHLCVRVEPALGRFGTERDYYVIRGY